MDIFISFSIHLESDPEWVNKFFHEWNQTLFHTRFGKTVNEQQYDRDPAQILIRWSLQKGSVPYFAWASLLLPQQRDFFSFFGLIASSHSRKARHRLAFTPTQPCIILRSETRTWRSWMLWTSVKRVRSAGIPSMRNDVFCCESFTTMVKKNTVGPNSKG